MKIYATVSGDTWDRIAYKTMGDGMLMDLLIAQNPQYVETFIFPAGVELSIPDVGNTANETLPEWRQ